MTVRQRQCMSPLQVWLIERVIASDVAQVTIARETGLSQKHISQMMTGVAEGSLTVWSAVLAAAGVVLEGGPS